MFEYFEKAFDNVWRKELWFKLLFYNINDKMYGIIIISTAKASQELYIITNFQSFSIVNMMSDGVKICMLSVLHLPK